jgi:hypothetical protein
VNKVVAGETDYSVAMILVSAVLWVVAGFWVLIGWIFLEDSMS